MSVHPATGLLEEVWEHACRHRRSWDGWSKKEQRALVRLRRPCRSSAFPLCSSTAVSQGHAGLTSCGCDRSRGSARSNAHISACMHAVRQQLASANNRTPTCQLKYVLHSVVKTVCTVFRSAAAAKPMNRHSAAKLGIYWPCILSSKAGVSQHILLLCLAVKHSWGRFQQYC